MVAGVMLPKRACPQSGTESVGGSTAASVVIVHPFKIKRQTLEHTASLTAPDRGRPPLPASLRQALAALLRRRDAAGMGVHLVQPGESGKPENDVPTSTPPTVTRHRRSPMHAAKGASALPPRRAGVTSPTRAEDFQRVAALAELPLPATTHDPSAMHNQQGGVRLAVLACVNTPVDETRLTGCGAETAPLRVPPPAGWRDRQVVGQHGVDLAGGHYRSGTGSPPMVTDFRPARWARKPRSDRGLVESVKFRAENGDHRSRATGDPRVAGVLTMPPALI